MSLTISRNRQLNRQHPHLAIRDLSGNSLGYLFHNETETGGGLLDVRLADNAMFQHIPNKNTERDIIYVAGMSGSGKSYYIKKYAEEYHAQFPKNEIYLFSFKNIHSFYWCFF